MSLSLNAIHLQKMIAVEEQAFTQNRLSTISLDINKNIILAKAYLNASQRSQFSIILLYIGILMAGRANEL